MPKDKDEVIDLIQKCLRLSESPNENEAEAALGKAQELLEKYNLTMEQVRLADDGTPPPELISQDIQVGGSKWRKHLLFYIARNNFCSVVLSQNGIVYLLGRTPNVAAVLEMANWVMPQLDRMSTEEASKIKGVYLDPVTQTFQRVSTTSKRGFRNDFLWGAIKRIDERLKESRQKRVDISPDTKAMVISVETELRAFISSQFPHLHKTGTSIRTSSKGYSTGYEAANGVSLVGPSRHIEPGGRYLNSGKNQEV